MVIAFANNQTLVAVQGTPTIVFTDWVPMGGNDRASCQSTIHSIAKSNASTTVTLVYLAQVSNDGGQSFTDESGVTDTLTTAATERVVGAVNGVLVRFKYTLTVAGGSTGDMGAVCFDLHVNFDHV